MIWQSHEIIGRLVVFKPPRRDNSGLWGNKPMSPRLGPDLIFFQFVGKLFVEGTPMRNLLIPITLALNWLMPILLHAQESFIADNECRVVFEIPDGTEIVLDSNLLGDKREFTFRSLDLQKIYKSTFEMRFPSGKVLRRDLLVQGGRRLQLSEIDPGLPRPEVVSQLPHAADVRSLAFSPDGELMVSGSDDGTIKVWMSDSGKLLATLEGFEDHTQSVVFSPDGRLIAACDFLSIKLWDRSTGKLIKTLEIDDDDVPDYYGLSISPDGGKLAVGSNNFIQIWDIARGNVIRSFGDANGVCCTAFTPDGRKLISMDSKGIAIRDVSTGRVVDTISDQRNDTISGPRRLSRNFALTSDGRRLLWGDGAKLMLWDLNAGKLLSSFNVHDDHDNIKVVSFSAKGDVIAAGRGSGHVDLWSADGKLLSKFRPNRTPVNALAVSPNGIVVAAAHYYEGGAATPVFATQLWDVRSGNLLKSLGWEQVEISTATISLDKSNLGATGVVHRYDGEKSFKSTSFLAVWDLESGRRRNIENQVGDDVYHVIPDSADDSTLAPDGRLAYVVAGGDIMVKDSDGSILQKFQQKSRKLDSVTVSPDGDVLVVGTSEGLLLLDPFTGKEVGRLFSFVDDDWLVVTPEGLFDGTEGGQRRVFFRVGDGLQITPVHDYYRDFYRAGLLARLFRGERPLPTTAFRQEMPPAISIESPTDRLVTSDDQLTMRIVLKDQGGGIGEPEVLRNGATLNVGSPVSRTDDTVVYSVPVRLEPGANPLRVIARTPNRGGPQSSEMVSVQCTKNMAKPDLYVLAIGVNEVPGFDKLDFADRDAERICDVFAKRASPLYGNVYVYPLCNEKASKQNVKDACEEIAKKARPQDTLLVYLAGHGKRIGQQFFFLPANIELKSASSNEDIAEGGLSTDTLFDQYLAGLQAGKRITVIDACHSGAALDRNEEERDSYTMQDVIERLTKEQGRRTLVASGADEKAKGFKDLGHGALTYTLLAALGEVDAGPLKDAQLQVSEVVPMITVEEWFGYAVKHMPIVNPDQHPEPDGSKTNFALLPVGE